MPGQMESIVQIGFVLVPPIGPVNLIVTAASNSTVSLQWDAAINGSFPTYLYYIYRNGNQVGGSNTLNFTDINLSPLTTYSYYVIPVDLQNNLGSQSNTVNVTTGS
jgi:chitodextrinase